MTVTTAAALIGRLITGLIVDRLNRRFVASATLVVQLLGVAILALSIDGHAQSSAALYVACALFGLGVGNMTTLPGLILAVEWPRERFNALIGLVVGILATRSVAVLVERVASEIGQVRPQHQRVIAAH